MKNREEDRIHQPLRAPLLTRGRVVGRVREDQGVSTDMRTYYMLQGSWRASIIDINLIAIRSRGARFQLV